MKKITMAVAAAFIAMGTVAAPARAELLDFSFTTSSGATGTFTLDTDTPPASVPALVRPGTTGIAYLNAVSNYSFSSSYLNLSNITADWTVAPSITSNDLDFPDFTGVLSGIAYPEGCLTAPGFTCISNLAVLYTGNQAELPELSDDPSSYPIGIGIDLFEFEPRRRAIVREDFTNFQVVRKRRVPEPGSGLSILASGIGGLGLLLKRKMKTNKPLAI